VDQSQAPNTRNEESGDANSHVSTLSESAGSSHETQAAGTLNAPRAEPIQALLSGLAPYQLSWGERVRVNQTAKVWRSDLHKIFGGSSNVEWVQCNRQEAYTRMFCAKITAQPFTPTSTGSGGLVLFEPAWADTPHVWEDIFPVFISSSTARGDTPLAYMGDYRKATLPQKDIDWSLLPEICKSTWLKRFYSLKSPAGRALRARIRLRKALKREPSVSEVREGLQISRSKGVLKWNEIKAAFEKGEEKMQVMGIQCERYDSFLAGILLGNQDR
jgi:hypothetical protein